MQGWKECLFNMATQNVKIWGVGPFWHVAKQQLKREKWKCRLLTCFWLWCVSVEHLEECWHDVTCEIGMMSWIFFTSKLDDRKKNGVGVGGGGSLKAEIYNTSRFFLNKRRKKRESNQKKEEKASSSKHPRGWLGKPKYPWETPLVRRRENPVDVHINQI